MSAQTDHIAGQTPAPALARPRRTVAQRLQAGLAHVVWFWLAGLVIIFGLLNPFFFSTSNMQNVLVQATVLGLLGLAQSLVLLVGEIDLSIAAITGLSSALGALAVQSLGLPVPAGILLGIGVATLIGFVNGLCVTKLRMVSLIESLGMMITLQGALLALTKGNTITDMPDSYNWIGQATVGGWPVMPLVLLIGFIAMGFTLRRTILGRSLYATGGNAAAALVAGIRVPRIKIIAFTLSGFISGVAGWLLAAWQMAITSNQGEGFLLYAIAAPIIGGVLIFVAVAVDALRVNVLGEA